MNVTVAPILIPVITAMVGLFWMQKSRSRRVFFLASSLAQVFIAGYFAWEGFSGQTFVIAVGGWMAPLGISLVIDLFSAIMLTLATLTAFLSVLYGSVEVHSDHEHPLRLPLIQLLVMGVNLSFITGDFFNLFVAFEIMLVASYALFTLEADDYDIKEVYPYLAINLIGSALFLAAAGLSYALFGTLNFAHMSERAAEITGDNRIVVLGFLYMIVFGIKSGLFPLYYGLPNSYPILPAPLAALFSGLLTKVGVYVFIRMFTTVLPHNLEPVYTVLAWLSVATMIIAVLGAISKNFIRGILSYHMMSQIGYMLLALAFFTPLGIAASIFYMIHYILVKSSLFLIGGVAALLNGTDNLEKTGNLWKVVPVLGILFLLQAFSLAGLPPFSGFWGKYLIVLVGLQQGEYVLVGFSIAASVLTLFSMLKIWLGAFWTEKEEAPVNRTDIRWQGMATVIGIMAMVSLIIGIGAEIFIETSIRAADMLFDQELYREAVFSAGEKGAIR